MVSLLSHMSCMYMRKPRLLFPIKILMSALPAKRCTFPMLLNHLTFVYNKASYRLSFSTTPPPAPPSPPPSSPLASTPPLAILSPLHLIPLVRIAQTATAPNPPLQTPKTEKYHPLPTASSSGCKTATPAAAIAQRVTLAAAAAVLGLSGKTSTNSAL